jgi:hypothetical protein
LWLTVSFKLALSRYVVIIFIFSICKFSPPHVEGRPLKRERLSEQLPENFEAAQDEIPYLDVDDSILPECNRPVVGVIRVERTFNNNVGAMEFRRLRSDGTVVINGDGFRNIPRGP